MNGTASRMPARGLASLRRLTYDRPRVERCELCGAPVAADHQHLVDPGNHRILCACNACAILFDDSGVTQYRRIPREVREPAGFEITDEFWNALAIPIGLVFFFRSSASGKVLALYPSPAGPTETAVEEAQWTELSGFHPSIASMKPDVEALIVNRMDGAREYYIAPIDECYKLTGIIRRHWQGFSGGDEMWDGIRQFFESLKRRAIRA